MLSLGIEDVYRRAEVKNTTARTIAFVYIYIQTVTINHIPSLFIIRSSNY